MRNVSVLIAGLIACGPIACSAPIGANDAAGGESPAVEQREEAVSGGSAVAYYVVTRADERRCAYPACGGWYVRRVNRARTVCADGAQRTECRVAEVDLDGLDVLPADAAKFRETFGQGFGLVRGELRRVSGAGALPVDTLAVSEAWVAEAVTGSPPGSFYAVTSTGVRCFAAPCPTYHEAKLNAGQEQDLAEIDLGASGVNERQIAVGLAEVAKGGILVAGTHHVVRGAAGSLKVLVASEFYTPLRSSIAPSDEGNDEPASAPDAR